MAGTGAVYWWPEALHAVAAAPEDLAGFSYVVLEELVDRRVVLLAWAWPRADGQGHLFWTPEQEAAPAVATVDAELLRHQVYRPSRVQRPPRLGDVYAATRLGPGWGDGHPVADVRTLFEGPLFDISADAREAAKLAYQGAVATVRASTPEDALDRGLLAHAAERRAHLRAKQLRLSPPPRPGEARS